MIHQTVTVPPSWPSHLHHWFGPFYVVSPAFFGFSACCWTHDLCCLPNHFLFSLLFVVCVNIGPVLKHDMIVLYKSTLSSLCDPSPDLPCDTRSILSVHADMCVFLCCYAYISFALPPCLCMLSSICVCLHLFGTVEPAANNLGSGSLASGSISPSASIDLPLKLNEKSSVKDLRTPAPCVIDSIYVALHCCIKLSNEGMYFFHDTLCQMHHAA